MNEENSNAIWNLLHKVDNFNETHLNIDNDSLDMLCNLTFQNNSSILTKKYTPENKNKIKEELYDLPYSMVKDVQPLEFIKKKDLNKFLNYNDPNLFEAAIVSDDSPLLSSSRFNQFYDLSPKIAKSDKYNYESPIPSKKIFKFGAPKKLRYFKKCIAAPTPSCCKCLHRYVKIYLKM